MFIFVQASNKSYIYLQIKDNKEEISFLFAICLLSI